MKKILLASILFLLPLSFSVWEIEAKLASEAPFLEPVLWLVPYISAGLLLLLIIFVTVEVAQYITEAVIRLQPSTLAHVAARSARSDDISEIVDIAQEQVGNQITESNTRQLYNHNKHCLTKVVVTRTNELLGFFCVLPLTANGEANVMRRNLINDDLVF